MSLLLQNNPDAPPRDDLTWEDMLGGLFEELNQTTHSTRPAIVESCPATLREFVELHQFEVDNNPFSFTDREYLIPIFEGIRYDRGDQFGLVLMTGAQVAKSITAILSMVMATMTFWGRSFGYFLPDQEMTLIFSSMRFMPLVESCMGLRPLIGRDHLTGGKTEDRKRVRSLGRSTVYFSYMGGKTSTESLPMQGVWFDEVRRMAMQDVERASERISASPYPINIKLSTAKHPGADIDYYYKRSTMGMWHSKCRCKDGIDLARTFPNCVGERKGEVFYRCPKCDKRIARPVDGRYIFHQPERDVEGRHVAQILSPLWKAPRFWQSWLDATDKAEFYNSKLGLPYLDPESIVVTPEIAWGCVNPALKWQSSGTNCVMGVDQRGKENHVVIGWVGPNKVEIRHLAMVQADDPFTPMKDLMQQYDVDCCVLDALPNYNEAVRFAKAFPRRVFLSYYTDNVHMVRWSDRDEDLKALLRAGKDSKHEWHVMLDRYKSIEWSLMHWVNRQIACPNPDALTQEVSVKGLRKTVPICLGHADRMEPGLFWHLSSISRRRVELQRRDAVKADILQTGEFKMIWENIGIDPHFVHALNYMLVAGSRRKVLDQLILMDDISAPKTPIPVIEIQEKRPELPATQAGDQAQFETMIVPALTRTVKPGTCGACQNFQVEQQRCQARHFSVQAAMPAGECMDYVEQIGEGDT